MKEAIEQYKSDVPEYFPPASEEEIEELEKEFSIKLPDSYKRFLRNSNGVNVGIGDYGLELFSVKEVREMNREKNKDPENSSCSTWGFQIGSDGGGEMYVLDLRTKPISFGMIPYIGDEKDYIKLGNGFEEFIRNLYRYSKQ
jgi:hypothetical protein